MSNPERIGVFGGTFDPIHNAHLAIARAALDQAKLDRILFVVSARPPHKGAGPLASPEDRFAMVEAALRDAPRFEPSRVEVDRSGPSYMADTLDEIALQHPDSKLFLIVGYDSLIDLPNWRAPERIMRHAHLLVLPRPGDMNRTPAALRGHYDMLQFEMTSLSSTAVRERIARRESIDNLVPQPVAAIIKAKGLYHDNP